MLSLSFPPLFFGGLCLYFILVHPSPPPPSAPFLAFLIVFVLIFSGWSCLFGFPLSLLCGCLFCLCLFFHRELSLSSFLICLLQASFVLPGALALCTLMSTLTADFGLCWGKEGGRCGKTTLTGPRERLLGGWSSSLLGYTYFADMHFSSWPEVWRVFPQFLRIFESARISLSFSSLPVSLSGCSGALLSLPQLPAVLLFLKHVLPITAPLQHFSYVEHPLGRGVVFEEGEVIIDNSNKNKGCIRSTNACSHKAKNKTAGLMTLFHWA